MFWDGEKVLGNTEPNASISYAYVKRTKRKKSGKKGKRLGGIKPIVLKNDLPAARK